MKSNTERLVALSAIAMMATRCSRPEHANRIQTGDFGNPRLRRDQRVKVIVGAR